MKQKPDIRVIIPAFNEENAVGKVINEIPMDIVKEVIVVNNGSVDKTALEAKKAGATVLDQPEKGYGRACLKGIDYLKSCDNTDIVVFLDADYSDYPEETYQLVAPIINEDVDMVIGSRATGDRQSGSMTPQQIFGNWLATKMIRWFYNEHFTDLGPFRAIKYQKLLDLDMQDKTYGWTVEMQVKAAKQKFKSTEIPVKYRQRIGVSKVSGTVKGTVMAGYKIITTILKYAV
ncbi:glycosyltransferase family 2 protein [Marinigracilibium pacificum]|uniref:Glycosyltransferase family 2 protein n=1 Tax=Marinigracilibium pacificum TaxID=2729599 RepID=A0A848J578_9BACT|nr:glycosyltransferase family 2 protein [Marinigracilibium pacificum]NMM49509.1 glycosyltransferase family 2 protein [Marinigracilibium pacificum]